MPLADLARTLPAILDDATRRQHNVIMRPDGPGVTFIQLDDLKEEMLARLTPAVFLILETSPGNFQAWATQPGGEGKDFARRLRKGTGADATASGSTRVAGSVNFKAKYAPAFPRVAIHAVQPGRRTSAEEHPPLPAAPARVSPGTRRWPSYARCVEGAPLNSEETGPDVSRADFVWCMTAITWG